MILLNILIGNMISVDKTFNGKFSSTGTVPPDILKICKKISLEGIYDEYHKRYYPPQVIERIDISELEI